MKTEKNIEDYIPLYCGSPFVTANSSGEVNASTIGFIVHALRHNKYTDFKLALRPLSSMTEEEKRKHHMPKKVQSVVWFSPEDVRILCAEGFDLFNLIPEGLAIDNSNQ